MKRATSLRGTLLRWLLLPTLVVLPLNALFTYSESVSIANAAYDRSLLLSARTIAETLQARQGQLVVDLPYAAIDMTESGMGARVFYRIGDPDGKLLSGYDDLPPVPDGTPLSIAYPALVSFYDAVYRGLPVRVAALHQPVSGETISGMALVQVAETLEAREVLIRRILTQTVAKQLLLLGLAVALILAAVGRALSPLEGLRRNAEARTVHDLRPFDEASAPAEMRAFVVAVNRYIGRLAELIALRKRFIENAAHQLRTPITVLKTQVALAEREPDGPALRTIVGAMAGTADNAARLANQLLSLTRAEHGITGRRETVELVALCREVCLEFAPRAVAEGIELSFEAEAAEGEAYMLGDEVLLHESLVNLLDNAIKYAGRGAQVAVRVRTDERHAAFEVDDSGPGIPAHEREKVLRRFYRAVGEGIVGSGLGLSIVEETVAQHRGRLALEDGLLGGLRVVVELPRAT